MKTSTLLLSIGMLCAGATASAHGIESSMKGFNLQACSQDRQKCLVIKAEKTDGSQLKMLHSLSKPEVVITTKNSKTETLRGDSGYIDLEENQVVLYQTVKGQLTETAVDLSSFDIFSTDIGKSL